MLSPHFIIMKTGNIRKKWKEELPWYCIECGKEFNSLKELEEHKVDTGHK